MKQLIVILALLISASVQADVVKIIGINCQTKVRTKNGSGIVFNLNGIQYVVSSDHVTPSDNQTCYQAQTTLGEKVALNLLNSDWESGLSLLKLVKNIAADNTTLNDFAEVSDVSGMQNVDTVGFPSQSFSRLSDHARVVVSSSDRTPFVNPRPLIEIIGAQVEYGMSGGALISTDNGKIMGLMSHQRILLNPGEAAAFSEAAIGNTENHGLVIPAKDVVDWIKSSMAGGRSVYAPASSDSVRGAGLLFKENRPSAPIRTGRGRSGGDGVGIGGDDNDSNSVEIEISIENLAQFKAQMNSRPEFEWVNRLVPELMNIKKITVNSILIFNSSNQQIEKSKIKSTAFFIRSLRSGNAIPLISGLNSALPENPLKSDLSKLNSQDPDLINLKVLLIGLMDAKSQFGLISIPPTCLANLNNHPGWRAFFSDNFDLAVNIKAFVQSL